MRKVIFSINVSLDGCVDHSHSLFAPDEELMEHYTRQMREVGRWSMGGRSIN